MLAVAILVQAGLIGSMDGIWKSESGESVYTIHDGIVEYIADDLHGRAHDFHLTPEGSDLGQWESGRRLTCLVDTNNVVHRSIDASSSGYMRFTKGPLNGYGRVAYYTLARLDQRGYGLSTERVYRVGAMSHVEFGKTYANLDTRITVTEHAETEPSNHIAITGTVEYTGVQFDIKGVRLRTFAAFDVLGHSTGAVIGHGSYEWCPTATKLSHFTEGQWGPSDRIVLDFQINRATTSNGIRAYLTLKP